MVTQFRQAPLGPRRGRAASNGVSEQNSVPAGAHKGPRAELPLSGDVASSAVSRKKGKRDGLPRSGGEVGGGGRDGNVGNKGEGKHVPKRTGKPGPNGVLFQREGSPATRWGKAKRLENAAQK